MECIFCKIANGEVPIKKIYDNESFFSILDTNQKVVGHSLVISKKHFETLLDTPINLGEELLDCIKNTAVKLMEKYKIDGFNVLNNNFESAGQLVKHFHVHILPRRKGDKVNVFS
jgi:histidine triad (HIT) family protein